MSFMKLTIFHWRFSLKKNSSLRSEHTHMEVKAGGVLTLREEVKPAQ